MLPSLPALALTPLRLAPPPLLGLVIHSLISRATRADELEFLDGRCLRVFIRDAGLDWRFTRANGRLKLLARSAAFDTSISGELKEFILLAARREDPDTLFFQRRLVVEGDTELGLQVKNLLDGIELDALPPPLRWGLERAADLYCGPDSSGPRRLERLV